MPLPSIVDVARDGWTITIHQRVFDPIVLRGLGARTDEFLEDLVERRGSARRPEPLGGRRRVGSERRRR